MESIQSDIVITGCSGRFPESANVEEFKRNLFDGVDMVTQDDRRWPLGWMDLPERSGKLKDLESFDASFFSLHPKLADVMDPELRILLETTHETIIDAGVNPSDLRGSNTGVFIGVGHAETEEFHTSDSNKISGYEVLGCIQSMFANRVSYSFDFKGPSLVLDTACSSSLYALHQAVLAMRAGECDSAIVAGVTLDLKPNVTLSYHRLNVLSPDGKCKAFDADANGYVRAEAVAVILLQRYSDAKRIYASVVNTKTNFDGYKDEGITFPLGKMHLKLLKEMYEEAAIDPREISYFEAHGTGTKIGDPQELNAIAEFFCKNRATPLLIGSVKSNMGHSEAASGVCSIVKVLISMANKALPGNLHFKTPNPDIPSLLDRRLKVVKQRTKWEGGLVGLNSFGVGGTNAHAILKSFSKKKPQKTDTEFPKIIGVSGRTYEACQLLLESVDKHKQDDEFIGLIHNIYKQSVYGYNYRGFSILSDNKVQEVNKVESADKRPVWYLFSGMGTQWPGCGSELIKIPAFAESVERSAIYVKEFGLDLVNLIHNNVEKDFEDVVKQFVIITSIQVGLVDLLSSLGIHADGIIGISAGEMACAYADGSLTQEQTILASYWRGKCVQESDIIEGEMTVVGLSPEDIKKECPEDIDIAINLAADYVTIAGPKNSVRKFVTILSSKGVRIVRVNTSGLPFHSRYIAKAGEKLKLRMDEIIPYPKQRSLKWLSTSFQNDYCDINRNCNGDYFVNNLLKPVYLFETLKHVPANAITIEIAPHWGLKPFLTKTLAPTSLNLCLHKKLHPDNMTLLLTNLGKLFNAGIDVDFSKLYPPIEFPVSCETPMLNSLVVWDHSQKWSVANFTKSNQNNGQTVINLNIAQDEYKYLTGHRFAGRVVLPTAFYIFLVWKTFAKRFGTQFEELPIAFENINILQAKPLSKEGSVDLAINIFNGTGDFEICEENHLIVSGKIYVPEGSEKHQLVLPESQDFFPELLDLTPKDFDKELKFRGYELSGDFKGIKSSDNIQSKGELIWKNNWVSFMDTMIQFNFIAEHEAKLFYLPNRIQYLSIDPQKHLSMKTDCNVYKVKYHSDLKVVQSGGIEFRDIKWSLSNEKQNQAAPKLENYSFIPYVNFYTLASDPNENQFRALSCLFQIIKENLQVLKVRGIELCLNLESLMAPNVAEILSNEPLITYELGVITSLHVDGSVLTSLQNFDVEIIKRDISTSPVGQNLHFVISENVLSNNNSTVLSNIISSTKPEGFIILVESKAVDPAYLDNFGLIIASKHVSAGKSFVLLKKKPRNKKVPILINITGNNFSWLDDLKSALKKSEQTDDRILLVSQGEPEQGIIGLVNCIRQESEIGNNVSYIFIQDRKAPIFSLEDSFYTSQLEKQLTSNVFKNNNWGSYRHIWLKNDKLLLTNETSHAYVNTLIRGDLSSLRWIEGPLKFEKPDKTIGKELCEVYYASLNFRDILLATGKLVPDSLQGKFIEDDCILGMEFAGKNNKGQRVMGMLPARGLATTVLADKNEFLLPVPEKWSLKEAATIPVCYFTSYYALIVRGKLNPGESVLIHAGCGGVGLASISIALHTGCKIFTTVSTREKREFLKKTFPLLTDNCIGNSRDTSFEQMIKLETNGEGVDIVLNSLAEDKFRASVRCLRQGGRFLEIGKYDLNNDSHLGLSVFLKNTCFHGITVNALFKDSYRAERKQVDELVLKGIASGVVKPLPSVVFNNNQLEEAFRFMASGKHIGKVLIEVCEEISKEFSKSPAMFKKVLAISRTYFHPDKIYILVGGLGGIGMELSHWMISRGVKFIYLTSRSGVKTGYQSMWIRRWKKSGVSVHISTDDVTKMVDCEKLIDEASRIAPVGGIYNLAGLLHDGILENLNEQHFSTVAKPKIDGTRNLDIVSRRLCPLLDQFVVFSTISSGRGVPGQTNYGFANSAMERLVEKRREDGLPGLGIQWGPIGDAGMFTDNVGDKETAAAGTTPQKIYSCLNIIDTLLQNPENLSPILSSVVIGDKMRLQKNGDTEGGLVYIIGNILGIKDVKTVNQESTLLDLGLDSLITAEIKQTLERAYDIVLSVSEIRSLTFSKLKDIQDKDSPKDLFNKNIDKYQRQFDVTGVLEGIDISPKEKVVLLNPENNCNSDPIFFLSVPNMKKIATRIKKPVYGIECTKDTQFNTMNDLAKYYLHLIRKIQTHGPYTIVGFSYGTVIALEIAFILEADKERATLKLIDGSIDFVHYQLQSIDSYFEKKNIFSDDWKRKALSFFPKRLNSLVNFLELFYELTKLTSEEEMLEKVVEYVKTSPYTPEDIKSAARLYIKRFSAVRNHKFEGKISSSVLLIKASLSFMNNSEDYGLSKICDGKIEIKEIEGDHMSILTDNSIDDLIRCLAV